MQLEQVRKVSLAQCTALRHAVRVKRIRGAEGLTTGSASQLRLPNLQLRLGSSASTYGSAIII